MTGSQGIVSQQCGQTVDTLPQWVGWLTLGVTLGSLIVGLYGVWVVSRD